MAGTEPSIAFWITLRGVRDLVAEAFLSPAYVGTWAKEQLIPGLVAGRVRWRAKAADPVEKSHGFWQQPDTWFRIDWQENSVARLISGALVIGGVRDCRLIGVELAREDIEALLWPEEPRENVPARGPGAWFAAEIKLMKVAGEIRPGIRISKLASKLERRMAKAAVTDRSLRPIKAKSIENGLRGWGLWPIDSIQ
jgi:hypothetical protein